MHKGRQYSWEGRQHGAGAASLLREKDNSTARELRHCGVRGESARRGSGVIAAATMRGRRVTAAWEGRGIGVIATATRRGRRVTAAREGRGIGVIAAATRRGRGAWDRRHRSCYAAWEARHRGVPSWLRPRARADIISQHEQ